MLKNIVQCCGYISQQTPKQFVQACKKSTLVRKYRSIMNEFQYTKYKSQKCLITTLIAIPIIFMLLYMLLPHINDVTRYICVYRKIHSFKWNDKKDANFFLQSSQSNDIKELLSLHTWTYYPKTKSIITKHSSKQQLISISNDSYSHSIPNIQPLESLKTTLIMMAYFNHNELFKLLQTYASYSNIFSEIILMWNNENIPFDMKILLSKAPFNVDIIIYYQIHNSLSNRWMITKYHKFKTQSLMFIDDDIYATQTQMKCLLNLWNKNKNKIISSGGYRSFQVLTVNTTHLHTNKDSLVYKFNFRAANDTIFNYLLPGWGMTVSIENIFTLSNIFIKYNLIDIIDKQIGHCDDVAMALAFTVMFGKNNSFFYGIDEFRLETYEEERNKVQQPVDGGNYFVRNVIRDECLNLLLKQFKDFGLDYIPIYDHNISQHTVNCYDQNNSLQCPKSACYKPPENNTIIGKQNSGKPKHWIIIYLTRPIRTKITNFFGRIAKFLSLAKECFVDDKYKSTNFL